MTRLYILLLLPLITFPVFADARLDFKFHAGKDSEHRLTYFIKNDLLRYSEQGSTKVNLYDKSGQVFLSMDREKRTISRIDRELLKKHTESLNRQRLQALSAAEIRLADQLKSNDLEKKALAETVINQMRYPEFYGAHTLLRTEKTTTTKKIAGVECQVYNILRENQLLKQVCMADYRELGLSATDYDTLRQFMRFDYATQTSLMIAKGKTDFILVDYEEENIAGVPIEITEISEHENKLIFLLDGVKTDELDMALFSTEIQNPEK